MVKQADAGPVVAKVFPTVVAKAVKTFHFTIAGFTIIFFRNGHNFV